MNKYPFKGTLLVSDMDGTLLPHGSEIPRRNLEAIARYTAKGGRFALATGRSEASAGRYAKLAHVNAPSIVYNGAAIYDYADQKFLYNAYLPEASKEMMQQVLTRFPDVGAEIFSDGGLYVLNENEYTRNHMKYEAISFVKADVAHAPLHWNKALFAAGTDRLREVEAFLAPQPHEGWVYVFSDTVYYEALPEGITKGSTVQILADILKVGHDRVFGIGDYFNDLELVRRAAVGAVPANAPDELKEAADAVVCRCEDGAVADFIEYLEAHCAADSPD